MDLLKHFWAEKFGEDNLREIFLEIFLHIQNLISRDISARISYLF